MISQVDIIDYGTSSINPNPLKITRVKITYNYHSQLDTVNLYDINIKSHDATEVEQYIWHHQNLVYYNLFNGSQKYYGAYNFKFYKGDSNNLINSTRYFQTEHFDKNVSRDYKYDYSINNGNILVGLKEVRNKRVYTESTAFISINGYYNPYSSMPFYLIPILTDVNLNYEPDRLRDTPFYGINQSINQSYQFPVRQIFNVYYGDEFPPFIDDTIVKQIDDYRRFDGVDYPNLMKVVHTGPGVAYSSKHPNSSYFVSFNFDFPEEGEKK